MREGNGMEMIQISLKIDPEEEPTIAAWVKSLQEKRGRRVLSLNIRKAIQFYLTHKDESEPAVSSRTGKPGDTKGAVNDGKKTGEQ